MKDNRRIVELMEVKPNRYTPIEEVDEGHIAGLVMIGGALFVLVLVILILRLGGV
jgi:hypothetical protein